MGSAPSNAKGDASSPEDETMSVGTVGTAGADRTAGEVASLLFGMELSVYDLLSPEEKQQVFSLTTLLQEAGWKPGKRKNGVAVQYKFDASSKLFYSCFDTVIPTGADSIFQDFNGGLAQQRYSDVCNSEEVLSLTERSPPLGHERLVRGFYRMPYPMQDRDFVWTEWCVLLPTTDGGQLYLSIAQSPRNERELCPPESKYTRGHLELSATLARQAPGESTCKAAFVIQGDIKGHMPKSLQNLLAGNASSYLANFRKAHTSQPAEGKGLVEAEATPEQASIGG